MKRLLKIIGLKTTLNPHRLRHTHTSLLAQAGVNLEIIMHRLGHQDEQTTRQIYLHVTDEMQKDASINKLNRDTNKNLKRLFEWHQHGNINVMLT
ncbi:Phage integrase family protein [Piscibacillus halophilus]|uniref:Phage integrase family protein n=2 Tax=Piscibacillus halophilus TaxID=571933 RepID=A0A1H9G493_9BACI|nr:Phage integrase family protein [Piscibacillus halophilus]